jgi:hypothetical protein
MLYNPCLLSMQIYFDKVTEWALTQSGSTLFRQALASLEIDPGLHPLVPFFTSFIAEEIVKNMDNYPILLALMRLARSLLHNPHVHIEPYLHQLMPSIITCLIAKRLGRRSSDNHWDLRNFTASTVASTCKRLMLHSCFVISCILYNHITCNHISELFTGLDTFITICCHVSQDHCFIPFWTQPRHSHNTMGQFKGW